MRIIYLVLLLISGNLVGQAGFKQEFIASDIQNFWNAYDKIISTNDTILQKDYLNSLYIQKGSKGLQSLIEVRNYKPEEFLYFINNCPKFWKSIREKTKNVDELLPEIEADILKLKSVYPSFKAFPIYFAIGAFRTNGTIHDKKVLVGAELALADEDVVVDELPAWRQNFYREFQPRKNIALLCAHEYVHLLQNELVDNLLSKCLYEGIAEFVSCKATGKESFTPAIQFGKSHQKEVIEQFERDLFSMSNDYNWLWGENNNQLKVRDLGYFIGYEIAERYYTAATNKTQAIKELIELDYTNEIEVERIVDASLLLSKSLQQLYNDYQAKRPYVVGITPDIHGKKDVKAGVMNITIEFSEVLNGYNTGIDFGPLGSEYCPKISANRIWSADNKSITLEVQLEPKRTYQFMIDNTFRNENGIRLKPYIIEFKTQ